MVLFKFSNFYKRVMLYGLGIFLAGCEEDVTDKIKIDGKSQLVVTSFISPQDTVLTVQVQKTRPVVGITQNPNQGKIINATVALSDGTQTVPLLYEAQREIYRVKASALLIAAGKTYTLTVSTPDGLTAKGICTVPLTDGVTITDMVYTQSQFTPDWAPNDPQTQHNFSYKFQDAPGRDNYYHILASYDYANPNVPGKMERQPLYFTSNDVFIADERKDGLVLTTPTATTYTRQNDNQFQPKNLHVLLAVTDRNYYLYHQSIIRQQEVDDNPFAEPALIYTNIEGGLGVFGGYNQLKAIKQLN